MKFTQPFNNSLVIALMMTTAFSSCNKKEDPGLSICKISTYQQDGQPATSYNYTGDKLTSDSQGAVYTYDSNGKLTSSVVNGIPTTYTYGANGKLIQTEGDGSKGIYTYNASGQLTMDEIYYYDDGKADYVKSTYSRLTYPNTTTNNYNLRTYYDPNVDTVLQTATFTYDAKYNPLIVFANAIADYTLNNQVQRTYSPIYGNPEIVVTRTYTYTSTGYPLTLSVTSPGSDTLNFTYSYINCK